MLEEIGQIVTGKTPSSNVIGAFSSSGIPFVTPKDMDGRRWIETTERYLSEAGRQSLKNYLVPKDSVAVSCIGSDMGKAILLKKDSVTNQQINTIIVDASKHNPKYIYYVLSLKQEELKSIAGGSATPILNKGHFSKVVIELPDKVDQDNIVQVLDSLDCKIELNNQINQNLEYMAQAIFKSWFIDFEPVRAKIAAKQEGKDTELAAMCAISSKSEVEIQQMSDDDFTELQATAALFPDELVESELGEVPKGWEISKISKIGKVITGKTPSSKIENSFAEKGTFFITPTDIDTEVFVTNTNRYLSEYGEIAIKNSKVDEGSLCITCIGSQMGKVVITPKSAFTNQQINSILLFNSTLRNYIFLNLRQRRDEIFLIGSGGSTMPIINKSTFESLNLILPDLALIRKFDNFISPFFNNILSNSVENIELKNIRDALLPELLAGKINVFMLKDM